MFDKQKEFEAEVLPLIDQLSELCEKLGVGFVMGFCPANNVTEDCDDKAGYSLCVRSRLTQGNATCQLAAAAVVLDEEIDHPLSHAVLQARQEMIKAEALMPEILKFAQEHKADISEVIERMMREAERSDSHNYGVNADTGRR
jgi:hypothetical protein